MLTIRPDEDIPPEGNDSAVEVSQSAKSNLVDRPAAVHRHHKIMHTEIYQHNWQVAKDMISNFKGWPSIDCNAIEQ